MADIEGLYKKYGPMVYRQCFKILKNEDNALDALQDVFIQVLRRRNILNLQAPSSLLYTIATNISLNYVRKEKRRLEVLDDEFLDGIAGRDDHVKRLEMQTALDEIFASEKESTKTIAFLHYVDRMTLQETAEQTGLSVSGVRKRLRQLRKKVTVLEEV